MDWSTVIAPIFSAFGLSSAAGMNAYIPLLAVGLLARFGLVKLGGPYALLAENVTLIILSIIAILDFVGDKFPAVDHFLHAAGAFIHPIAGAIVFASQTQAIEGMPPQLSMAAGLVVAGGFHLTRAAVRPVATTTTAGMGNPVLSFIEDVISLLMSMMAIFLPLLGFICFVLMLIAVLLSWRLLRKGFQRMFGKREPNTPNNSATS